MIVGPCPRCLTTVQFGVLYSSETVGTITSDHLMVFQCPTCKGVNVQFYKPGDGPFVEDAGGPRRTDQWPPVGVLPPHPAVPGPVADDWTEAHKALGIGLWKSAVAMARRAVQGVCIDKGATSKKKLYDQINELAGSQTLHPTLVDLSHKIRSFGNVGAHPGDDGLDDVDEHEARRVVSFLDQLLHFVYELPDQLSKLNP